MSYNEQQPQQYNQQPQHQYNQTPQREKPQQIMNAVIVTGQYTTREGKQKKSYLTIGKLFIYAGGGMSLKLDAYPTANQTITFILSSQKSKSSLISNHSTNTIKLHSNIIRAIIKGIFYPALLSYFYLLSISKKTPKAKELF